MSRAHAFLILLVLWAAIYLPGLGSTELKGEEGRRILPAIEMLDGGDWLVPHLGGKAYLRKPPLVNWVIALSFKATGVRNEWTARLPSALAVLAMGAVIVALAGEAGAGLAGAVLAMTSLGLLAKARFAGAEIEGLYVPLFGIAMVLWLGWRGRPWLGWTVPFVFLGLGCLAKGPSFHLLFFYGIAGAVLWREKRMRDLLHPAHAVGVAICAGLFLAWLVPMRASPEAQELMAVWKKEGLERFTESEFKAGNYFANLPRALMDALPALLLVPMAWRRVEARASLAMLVAVMLIPGTLPRYVLPLGVPLAMAVGGAVPMRWVLRWGGGLGVASVLYALFVVPIIVRHDDLRPLAAEIDGAVRPGASLVIYDPGYQAALFYLRTPYRCVALTEDIPADAACVLARAKDEEKLARKRPEWMATRGFERRGVREFVLLERRERGGL